MIRFQHIVNFQLAPHYVYIQPCRDPQGQWFPTQYMLTVEYLETIISDWTKEWKKEGSQPLGEKNTQQAYATMPGQAHPN